MKQLSEEEKKYLKQIYTKVMDRYKEALIKLQNA